MARYRLKWRTTEIATDDLDAFETLLQQMVAHERAEEAHFTTVSGSAVEVVVTKPARKSSRDRSSSHPERPPCEALPGPPNVSLAPYKALYVQLQGTARAIIDALYESKVRLTAAQLRHNAGLSARQLGPIMKGIGVRARANGLLIYRHVLLKEPDASSGKARSCFYTLSTPMREALDTLLSPADGPPSPAVSVPLDA
jgi:hypothetical protein